MLNAVRNKQKHRTRHKYEQNVSCKEGSKFPSLRSAKMFEFVSVI